jgi:hypothetical protein
MTNHEILDNGPENWTHFDSNIEYLMLVDCEWHTREKCTWRYIADLVYCCDIRSRADIERIVELEKLLSTATGFSGNVTSKSGITFSIMYNKGPEKDFSNATSTSFDTSKDPRIMVKTSHANYMDSGSVDERSKDETKN